MRRSPPTRDSLLLGLPEGHRVRAFTAFIVSLFFSLATLSIVDASVAEEVADDPSAANSEIAILRDRYIQSLLPEDTLSQNEIIAAARKHASNFRQPNAWADIDYQSDEVMVWPAAEHLSRTLLMAKAARILDHRGEADKPLQATALSACDWWLSKDPQNPNWWWNEIGTPQGLGEIALFSRPWLSEAQLNGVVRIMDRSRWKGWTGQNLVWGVGNQIVRGCLQNDTLTVQQGFDRLYDAIRTGRPGAAGLQSDDSFHQHGRQLYSGGYGLCFAQDVGRYIFVASGTRFQIPQEKWDVYASYVLDGEQWMTWGTIIDYSTVGREITTPGKVAVQFDWTRGPYSPEGAGYALNNVVRLLSQLNTSRKREFQAYAKRLSGDATAAPFVGNKHFWQCDYMAHRRPGYFLSVKMFSKRMQGAELVNDEGKKSHHLSDGVTLLYRRGDEYAGIFPVWNWERLPGITAETAPGGDLDRLLPNGNRSRGETRFVGGVTNGTTGLAAMDLRRGNLRARKSWFCLDGVVVCLGAGIHCESDNRVVTTVNQCLAKTEVVSPPDASWAWHDDVGYIVLNDQKFLAQQSSQTGRWSDIGAGSSDAVTKNVFSMSIDHGARVVDGTYQYLIVPGVTAEEMPTRAASPPIKILSNTAELQAIKSWENGDLFAAAFYQPAKIDTELGMTLAVDQSCLALLTHDDQGWSLTLSNPLNEAGLVNVTINNQDAIQVPFPDGQLAGSSVTVRLPEPSKNGK
jgi:chondroitin AC lyase